MGLKKINFSLKDFFVDVFGEKVFLVGGTIRDFLLYGKVNFNRDIDLVVVDVSYEDIENKLREHGKTNTVGKSFAVVKFTKDSHTFDISVPRKDLKKDRSSHSHKNFLIESGSHITLKEDLERRDFTCNAIAMRLLDNEIYDPFKGMEAIKKKKMVMTGPDTFFDDPLRILRCARFSSVHHFSIENTIYSRSKKVNLSDLSKERIQEELFRLLMESDKPSVGLQEYFKLSILEKIFPELYLLTQTIQDSIFHPEKDEFGHHTVWIHTLNTVDVSRKLAEKFKLDWEATLALLLAALLHDIGKSITTRWEYKRNRMTITSLFHDSKGLNMANDFLVNLKVETRKNYPLRKVILNLIKNHHRLYDLYKNREKIGFKAISRIVRDLEGYDFLLVLLDFADRQSRKSKPLGFKDLDGVSKWYLKIKDELNVSKDTVQPLIMGKDLMALGVPSGKKMGEILNTLYEFQLDGQFKTKNEGIKLFKILQQKNQSTGKK
jgi:tRNA nucleotidyltransferase (CCA-adding enzyme)